MQAQGTAITGIGTANPLGLSWEETASNMLAGRSGVRPITRFDASRLSTRFAGQIDKIPVPRGYSGADFAQLERMDQLLLWCATEALQRAGLWEKRSTLRLGIVLGNGGESGARWETHAFSGRRCGPRAG